MSTMAFLVTPPPLGGGAHARVGRASDRRATAAPPATAAARRPPRRAVVAVAAAASAGAPPPSPTPSSSSGGGDGSGGGGGDGAAPSALAPPALDTLPLTPIPAHPREWPPAWAAAATYAIYDDAGALRYVSVARSLRVALLNHRRVWGADHPAVTAVRAALAPPDAPPDRAALEGTAKAWLAAAVAASPSGSPPPGNDPADGASRWRARPPDVTRTKPNITLPPGTTPETAAAAVGAVVAAHPVVLFLKGTRADPACGFSARTLDILRSHIGAAFETLNVLDEAANPGLRDAVKAYASWPTVPQLYVRGEFLGGADIVGEMHDAGELRPLLVSAVAASSAPPPPTGGRGGVGGGGAPAGA